VPRVALLIFLFTSSGCFTAGYLAQAAGGQYELIHRARSLRSVTQSDETPPRIRALLSKVPAIKRFGQLNGLTPTENYTDYVDLHRSAAVYVVQGCAPLEFKPRRWTFPIVGSVPYLGFFDEQAARAYARTLEQEEAIDVTVRTAAAYSTLGWFRDAVLSTMIPDGPEAFGELANTILHESVHATVYVVDQSAFNESLASYVADELTWLLVVGRGGLQSAEAKAWIAGEARGARFLAELRRAHDDLDALYRSPLSNDEKLAKKNARLDELQKSLGLRRRYNNADLAGVRTYDSGHDAFARLHRACGSWPRLFDAIRSLTPDDFTAPQQAKFDEVLDALAARECPLTSR
jgi:predicted aminopeptidase